MELDVLDKPCEGIFTAKGGVVFDIYHIDESHNRMTMGNSTFFLDKQTAEKRPDSLDESHEFVRK